MADGELDYVPMQTLLDGCVACHTRRCTPLAPPLLRGCRMRHRCTHASAPAARLTPASAILWGCVCAPVTLAPCSGLADLCTMSHWPATQADGSSGAHHPAPGPCLFTEPTQLPMVEGAVRNGVEVPAFRLDYALGNAAAAARGIHCAVVQTDETATLSDHYPIACRYARSAEEDANGFDWR